LARAFQAGAWSIDTGFFNPADAHAPLSRCDSTRKLSLPNAFDPGCEAPVADGDNPASLSARNAVVWHVEQPELYS